MPSSDDDCVGRVKLNEWLRGEGRTQAAIARALRVSQPTVYAWVRGNSRPESHLREALEVLTGIAKADWEFASEREQRDAAIERIRANTGTEGK
jgi:transcriptional regulator with XRE-family HTH domain